MQIGAGKCHLNLLDGENLGEINTLRRNGMSTISYYSLLESSSLLFFKEKI